MRALLGLFVFAGTAVAEEPVSLHLEKCEYVLVKHLAAPSTYQRIRGTGDETGAFIEFDVMNAYGVPMRHIAECTFGPPRIAHPELPARIVDLFIDGKAMDRDPVETLSIIWEPGKKP